MDVVFHQLIIVALITVAGAVAAKLHIITPVIRSGLSRLVLNVAVPCAIIASGHLNVAGAAWFRVGYVLLISLVFHMFIFLAMRFGGRRLISGKAEQKVAVLCVTFGNVMFVGFPIISGIYGSDGLFLAAIFTVVFNALFYTMGTGLVRREGTAKLSWRQLIVTPFNVSIFIMFVLLLTQYKVPAPVQETLTMLGNLCTPLSLLVIGAMVSESHILSLIKDYRLLVVSGLRLVVAPLLMLAAMYFLPLDVQLRRTMVALAAMPGAAMTAMVAEQEECAPRFATLSVVQSTILFLLVFPLMIYLSHRLLV
ncbi:MAG TPA: AEC family transporter [Clostridiaceae bacterium]|nr:AEC family transporter [Clostridiaceae bacterium]